ncbi:MAG: FliM/FliN family flagellar motor switch protein [Acidobacteria bacterium]|nr:FliM/FliN family flagellar motor switch protein [Acidobacteriota bacterium]
MDPRAFTAVFASRLAEELASALGSAAGQQLQAVPGDPCAGDGWSLALSATGAATGACTLWLDRAGAAAIARLILSVEEDPDEAAIVDMLREISGQALGVVCLAEPFAGTRVEVAAPVASPAPVAAPCSAFAAGLPGGSAVRLALAGTIGPAAIAGTAPAPGGAPPPATPAAAPPRRRRAAQALDSPNLDVVLDIELPLVVRFGRTSLSLKALSALGPGSIVDMGRSPDDPVELLVGDRAIALGEVVIVEGNYGVRIVDLVSAAERVRALEG